MASDGQEYAITPRDAADAIIKTRKIRCRFMVHDGWENALFFHWPVDYAVLRQSVPKELELDLYDGQAYVGLVLLTERGVKAPVICGQNVVPAVDHLGANIRTYVKRNGISGIYFLSLECSNWLVSVGARMTGIPYFPAKMDRAVDIVEPADGKGGRSSEGKSFMGKPIEQENSDGAFTFNFTSKRSWCPGLASKGFPSVSARWKLDKGAAKSKDWRDKARFFTERYSVYTPWPAAGGPLLLRGDVEHPEWETEPVLLEHLDAEQLITAAGFPCKAASERAEEVSGHACFSRGVGPVNFWMLEPC
mmetsp:Transcript_35682/g.81839  ORF Transcript_35682/g.81839 Transcript_35682/m.81839 type:complete len:305 (-) Transcript_35682:518-1432(-)